MSRLSNILKPIMPILTGILVGYVANRIMSGEGKGCCMNLIIGIIGSYAGTFISHLLNIE